MVNCVTLPWACRILEYGKVVEVLGTKEQVGISITSSDFKTSLTRTQDMFPNHTPKMATDESNHILSPSMAAINGVVHTSIMYTRWVDWDGKPVAEKPLFYQGITEEGAATLSSVSDEVLKICEGINKSAAMPKGKSVQVLHMKPWFFNSYGSACTKTDTLYDLIKTNPGYNGLTHPMKDVKDEESGKTMYMPNWGYRYLSEDIPMGLMIPKGFADLLGIDTPTIDKLLRWVESVTGNKYMDEKGKLLEGGDVAKTRAPQAYGYKSVDDVLKDFA